MKLKLWQKILIGIFALLLFVKLLSQKATNHPYYSNGLNKPLVIAHQGGDGIFPGESMYAYQKSVEMGVDVLEMDIHISKDGVLVLMHDETVDRTTNGSGEVEMLTLVELKNLDAAYGWTVDEGKTYPFRGQEIKVATLEEVFQAFPEKLMTIEIKKSNTPMVKPLCAMIREYDMQEKILVASFYDDKIKEFRKECPEVATSSAKQETTIFVLLSKPYLSSLYSPQFQALQVPEESGGITVMSATFVNAAHERNLSVEPWTINDAETMHRFIDWGVDGIITDRPDIMLELLGR